VATLQEIETHWSLDDLMLANDVMDYRNSLIRKAQQEK
jgi:hypothetical protein